jgi:hypothetical protein
VLTREALIQGATAHIDSDTRMSGELQVLSKTLKEARAHTLKYANIDLEIEVIRMPGKKEKVEGAAEKTGEAVGKGLKKGAKAVDDFGKGIKKGIKKEE